MAETIRNPVEWLADQLGAGAAHLASVVARVGSGDAAPGTFPEVRRIGAGEIREALRKGVLDFAACRTDVVALCLVYPVAGAVLVWLAFDLALLPLIFPIVAGFTLLGPVAAVGLYEMSRRRERGEPAGWSSAFAVVARPAFGAILLLGMVLAAIFIAWLLAAQGVYELTLGPEPPESAGTFLRDVLFTWPGWAMTALGSAVGFLFALLVLAVSVVSFPLLLDRHVGLPVAVATSVRAAAQNPRAVGTWGLIVAAALALGSVPAFLGLIVALPVLGHATWHLYRALVVPLPEEAAAAGKAPPSGAGPADV